LRANKNSRRTAKRFNPPTGDARTVSVTSPTRKTCRIATDGIRCSAIPQCKPTFEVIHERHRFWSTLAPSRKRNLRL
jgi:hypothetical protein